MTEKIRSREVDPLVVSRAVLLVYAALFVFGLVVARLWFLQVVQGDHFQQLAENNRLRMRTVRAPRGAIVDRQGRPLAETQPSYDLVCTPVDVADLDREMSLVEEVVGEIDAEEVRAKIDFAKKHNPFTGIVVARDLSFEQVSVLEFNREAVPGFAIQIEAKRSYPHGAMFAHVLGYVGEVSETELEKSPDPRIKMGDVVGKYGLEKTVDNVLRGINGGRYVEVDAAGRDRRLVSEVPSRTGGMVWTSLDLDLQKAAFDAMAESDKAGAVVAMVPSTGEVLAFVSAPAFDPNVFSRGIKRGDWAALMADPRKPMQNKGLQGTYAPGSTVKPFVAMAALETGTPSTHSTRCGGSHRLGNKSFRCWKASGHGSVDMHRAILQSCDVFFYQMGLALGPDPVVAAERGAGLGTITGIDLPDERMGLVPDPEWKLSARKEKWAAADSLLQGIGQGAIHITPLEMAVAYSTIATGGVVPVPRVRTKFVGLDGVEFVVPSKTARTLGWKLENVDFVRNALWGVVNGGGTGGQAKVVGADVGGKTGTAQVAQVKGKMIKSEDLAYDIRDHAWFAGFAPTQAPEIAVVAMIEHGGHGGSAAAPVVRAVVQEYFRKKAATGAGRD